METAQASILVVEDERIVALDLQERLAQLGYTVAANVGSGQRAVEEALALRPDLVLMDVKLRGAIDGIEAARQIRERLDVPIVYMTAFGDEATLARAQITRPYGYIVKPFHDRELRVTVEVALENARLYREAQQAIRVRDEVLAIVAHDLRTPLSAVLFGAELVLRLEDEAITPERVRGRMQVIRRAALRMQRLIGDLLDLSRLDEGRLSLEIAPCDVVRLVRDAVEAFEPQRDGPAAPVQTQLGAALGEVRCDRERILQVLSNLISNAREFTPPEGRVTVGAERAGDEVRFSIVDTGRGIDEQELPHLFERYWTSRPAGRGGLGLGLYITRGIVHAHGGRVGVESALGRGSTFWFTLPVADAGAGAEQVSA